MAKPGPLAGLRCISAKSGVHLSCMQDKSKYLASLAGCAILLLSSSMGGYGAQPQAPSQASSLGHQASLSSQYSLFDLRAAGRSKAQPPPRRYGRPNYSSTNSNADGSPKYTFYAAAGGSVLAGNTHRYETPGYAFQAGAARNLNKNFGVGLEVEYDHFGLQASTIASQKIVIGTLRGCNPAQIDICVGGLDGTSHVWSIGVSPTYSFATQGTLGAYLAGGGGFYHKVTAFTQQATATQCNSFGCQQIPVNANAGTYTSNAPGFNVGLGFTVRLSPFASTRVFLEARYVMILNSQRAGFTAQNIATTHYNGSDLYPANSNRTTYIPIKFGIRF